MSAVPADIARPASRWQISLVALAALIAAVLLLYRETAVLLVSVWENSGTFAHAFLVPPISLWLIWRRRHALAALQPRPWPLMLVPMLACAVLWFLGNLVAVNATTQFALVAMIVLAVPLMLGFEVTRTILFPLGFLFFCVPVGDFLLPTLMEATADVTIAALQFTGIPVYREGLRFVIPSGSWSVVEACSGVRYLIASFMVGSLFAYLNYRSMKRRWIFVGASILVPIVANWFRAYMIVMIGHLSSNELATGVDHLVYGWVFFGLVIMAMFVVGSRWAQPDAVLAVSAAAPAMSGPPARPALGVLLVALAVLLVPQGLLWAVDHQTNTAAPNFALPDQLEGGWTAAPEPLQKWQPRFVAPSQVAERSYMRDGRVVSVYVAYYRAQTYERKLVSSQNYLVDSNDPRWNHVLSGSQPVETSQHDATVLRTAELLGSGSNRLTTAVRLTVWQTYWVNDRLTSSDMWAKVQGALGRLLGRGDDAAAVLIYTDGEPANDQNTLLGAFARTNLQPLVTLLRQARDQR